jgi:hypothetical protein
MHWDTFNRIREKIEYLDHEAIIGIAGSFGRGQN